MSCFSSYSQIDNFKELLKISEIKKVAKNYYKIYLEKIPEGQEEFFGFLTRKEFDLVDIGDPYKIYKLTNEFCLADSIENPNLISETDNWEVPLHINGNIRCLLHIVNINNSYNIIGIGQSIVANEINMLKDKNFATLKNKPIAILFIPSLRGVYIFNNIGNNQSEYKFVPTYSTLKFIHIELNESSQKEVKLSINEIISSIRKMQKLNFRN